MVLNHECKIMLKCSHQYVASGCRVVSWNVIYNLQNIENLCTRICLALSCSDYTKNIIVSFDVIFCWLGYYTGHRSMMCLKSQKDI